MKIEKTSHMKSTYAVSVDANELMITATQALPYACTLGTVDADGVQVWTPAGYCPRGYRAAAQARLENVRASMFIDDSAGSRREAATKAKVAAAKVFDSKSGDRLAGTPTAELTAASIAAETTGHVYAYLNETDGAWHYVQAHDVDRLRSLGETVRAVWVE